MERKESGILEKEKESKKVFVEVGMSVQAVTWFGKREFGENEFYIGIDLASDDVKKSRENTEMMGRKKENMAFIQGDAERLPLPSESADEVFFGNVLGYPMIPMEKRQKFLDEAERVLKAGGRLIIKETNTPLNFDGLDELIRDRNLRLESFLTPKDKGWNAEIEKYENLTSTKENDPPLYLLYLRKIEKPQSPGN